MGLSGVSSTQWWNAILGGIGAPANATNYGNLNAWTGCEGGSASNNPFNTTEPWPGATDYNSVGVKNYASFTDGVNATVATLKNGNYGAIINALQTSAGRGTFALAVGNSPWGTSGTCIAGASGLPTPGGQAPPSAPSPVPTVNIAPELRAISKIAKDLVWQRMWWVAWYRSHRTSIPGPGSFPRP